MKRSWIEKAGKQSEEELIASVKAFISPDAYILAGCTDRYIACKAEAVEQVLCNAGRMLELRVFTKEAELWAHRSMIGSDFNWRIAADTVLRNNIANEPMPFFNREESWCQVIRQKLDIDTEAGNKLSGEAHYGGRMLVTTGGGVYELPITDENAVELLVYYGYDEDGAAIPADFRVVSFVNDRTLDRRDQ